MGHSPLPIRQALGGTLAEWLRPGSLANALLKAKEKRTRRFARFAVFVFSSTRGRKLCTSFVRVVRGTSV